MNKSSYILRLLCLVTSFLIATTYLFACSSETKSESNGDAPSTESTQKEPATSSSIPPDDFSTAASSTSSSAPPSPVAYPTGWLVAPVNDVPANVPLSLVYLADFDTVGHRNGQPIPSEEQEQIDGTIADLAAENEVVVMYSDSYFVIPADYVLVNMPDVLPQASYDIVYSYSSTSQCAGEAIPGVTGERLPGYMPGKQENTYLGEPQFVVPCAYRTAVKSKFVCDRLALSDLKLLVFDAYRPMTAQLFLSEAFESAYYEDETIRNSLGDWSLTWYVANGPSGHNYGTDLDVGVCDTDGNPMSMPSSFDSFDETGHLTTFPMSASDITAASYREEVSTNGPCVLMHEAFSAEGFSELASEWWHFADEETEATVQSIVGYEGLDFVATINES